MRLLRILTFALAVVALGAGYVSGSVAMPKDSACVTADASHPHSDCCRTETDEPACQAACVSASLAAGAVAERISPPHSSSPRIGIPGRWQSLERSPDTAPPKRSSV